MLEEKIIETKDKKLLLGVVGCMFKAMLLNQDNPDYLKVLIHEITDIPLKDLENIV